MTLLLNAFGIALLLIVLIELLINPYKALALSLLCLASDYDVVFFNYTFASKALALLCCLICVTRGFYKRELKVIYLALTFLAIELFNFIGNASSIYTFSDFITSFATIFLGVCIFMVRWPEQEGLFCFKVLSWMPIYLVLAGIICNLSLFENNRISTIGLVSQLPFWCAFGFISSYQFYRITNRIGYLYLGLLDILLIFLTSSRGGAIFAIILLIPFMIDTSKRMNKGLVSKLVLFSPAIVAIAYYGLSSLFAKSFSTGELNTSNRLVAWQRLLELSSNKRLLGLGFGSLKTTSDGTLTGLGFSAAHNEYIRFIYETGIIGLIIVIVMFIAMFRIFINADMILEKRWAYAIIFGFMIYSITDNTISAVAFWAPFTTVLSLCKSNYASCRRFQGIEGLIAHEE